MKLITVPHSGTVFTRELLKSWGLEFETHHADVKPKDGIPWTSRGEKIVVTLRDPVLGEITSLNRGRWVDFTMWETLASWHGLENVHFFRIDCPETDQELESALLAYFLDIYPVPSVDWTPKNTSHDGLGLKKRYQGGERPKELEKIWSWLEKTKMVGHLFRSNGYDLPWMGSVGVLP